MKICFVTSSGGHLTQLYALKPWWEKHNRFWVTFEKEDATSILRDEETYWAYHPTNRNVKNLFKNLFVAWRILREEKPDIIMSTGAGVAVPFFWLGKFFGCKLIYIEVFDRIDSPTLSGRLVYYFTDKFLVQWEAQKRFYPKSEHWGSLF